jgi:hypothetical protein
MAKNRPDKRKAQGTEIRKSNVWAAIRDVLVASINKGQLPIAGIVLFLIILAVKMPSEQAGKLLFELLGLFVKGYLLGYFLFAASVLGWFIHVKIQRRTFKREIARAGDEKTKLQEKLLPKLIESSEV